MTRTKYIQDKTNITIQTVIIVKVKPDMAILPACTNEYTLAHIDTL